MKLKNKLKNKLNNKLNKKLVSLLLIIMVTLTAIFIASCAEKKTTAGGTTGGGGSITDGGITVDPCIPDAPAANSFVSKWDVSKTSGTGANKIKLPLIDARSGGSYNFTVDWGDCSGKATTITAWDSLDATHTYTADAFAARAAAAATATDTKAKAVIAANKAKKAAEDVVAAATSIANAAANAPGDIVAAADAIVAVAAGSIDGSIAGSTADAVKAVNAAVADAEVAKGDIDGITAPPGSPLIADAVNDSQAKAAIAVTAAKAAAKAVNAAANAADAAASTTTFTVTITGGPITGWMFGNPDAIATTGANNGLSDAKKLVEISSFGPLNLRSPEGYQFYGAENLTITANAGTPDLTGVEKLNSAFANTGNATTGFNSDISGWNVSEVDNMNNMFSNAKAFDQPLSGWNDKLGEVGNVSGMFYDATSFNGDISGWKIGKAPGVTIINMREMFYGASEFNQNLKNWDVSKVNNMNGMFSGATAFNNGANPGTSAVALTWTVDKVNDMQNMFKRATSFNQPIDTWNVRGVRKMTGMFNGATSFNQNLSAWEGGNNSTLVNVTDMRSMFQGASAFNNGDGPSATPPSAPPATFTWDVSGVTVMNDMFNGASVFNQNLGSWTATQVTSSSAYGNKSGCAAMFAGSPMATPGPNVGAYPTFGNGNTITCTP